MKRHMTCEGIEHDEAEVHEKVMKGHADFPNPVDTKLSKEKEKEVIRIVWRNDVAKLKQCIDEGVSPNTIIPFMKQNSLLHIAQHKDIVELLLREGAKVNKPNTEGRTPLFFASTLEKMGLLLKFGANVSHSDQEGETALFHMKTAACVEKLLENGANKNHENKHGETALFKVGESDVVKALIAKGLDVSHENRDGRTPLFFAKTYSVAKLLIDNGANVSHVDKNNETPIFPRKSKGAKNAQSGHNDEGSGCDTAVTEVTRLLLQYGAKTTHLNHNGKSAIDEWKEDIPKSKTYFQERGYSSIEVHTKVLQPKLKVVSEMESSPDSVIARLDSEAETRFDEAICNGYSPFRYGTVTVIGPFGVGKTTLVHGLLNDDLSDFPSTDGIEFHDGKCRFSIKSGVWETGDLPFKMESKLCDVMEYVRKRDQTNGHLETNGGMECSESVPDDKFTEVNQSEHSSMDDEFLPEQETKIPSNPEPVEMESKSESVEMESTPSKQQGENGMLREFMEKAVELDKTNSNDKYAMIQFRDFAGQAAFYTTHNLFLTSNSLYLLVFNVSIDLNSMVEDKDLDPERKIEKPVTEFLLYWTKVIHFNTTLAQDTFPRIIIVGTHVDDIEQERREVYVKQQFENVRKLFSNHPVLAKHLIIDERNVINGKNHGDTGYLHLKNVIMQEILKYPNFGRRIPTNWIPVEHMMQKIKTDKHVLSMTEVQEINQKWKHPLNDDQLLEFLLTQHAEGNLIYFNEMGLDGHVLLNQKGIIEALRLLITPETFWSKDPNRREPWRLLKETGQIPEEKIIKQWQNSPHLKENQEFLLNLMERLDLLVKPKVYENGFHKSVDYFIIPCMLNRTVTESMVDKCICDSRHGLIFTFQFLTQAMFHRLLTSFIATFPIAEDNRHKQLIYSTFCVFLVDKFHRVALKMQTSCIKMWITHKRGWSCVSDLVCFSIHKFMTENITVITRGYNNKDLVNTRDIFNTDMMLFCHNENNNCGINGPTDGCSVNLADIPENQKQGQCKVHKRDFQAVWTYLKSDSDNFMNAKYCPDECEGLKGSNFKDGEISEVEFGRLSRRICNDLQLGIELGLRHSEIENIQKDYYRIGTSAIVHQILLAWQRQTGRRKATMHQLQKRLLNLHELSLIDDLHCLCEVYHPEKKFISGDKMNETIQDEQLDQLALHVGTKVLHLAAELGLLSPHVQRIRMDTTNTLEQIQKIFQEWKKSKEKKHLTATFKDIALAFIEVGIGLDPILDIQEEFEED